MKVKASNVEPTFIERHKILLKYFQLVGLAPFSLNSDLPRSIISEVHTVLLVICFVAIFGVTISIMKISDEIGGVTWFATVGISVSINISCIINVAEAFRTRTGHKDFLSMLSKIDKHLLEILPNRDQYDKFTKAKIWKYSVMAVIAGGSLILSTLSVVFGDDALRLTLLIIPVFELYNRAFQLLFYFDAINDRIELYNMTLDEMNDTTLPLKNRKAPLRFTHDSLIHAKNFVAILLEANEAFEHAFGWSLVFVFFEHFVGISCNIYLIFVIASGYNAGDSIYENIALPIPTMMFLLTVPYAAMQCDKELQDIVKRLHEKIDYKDIESYNVVNALMMHVSKNGFTVSAQGFFGVEPSMVQAMIGAIFNYMIILIQFKQQEEARKHLFTMSPELNATTLQSIIN